MRGNAKNFGLREDPQDMILPRFLKNAGYHTAMIGKSGVAADSQDGAFPNRKGFDHFFGFTSHWDAHYYYPEYLWRNGKKVEYPGNTKHDGPAYSSTEVTKEALTYLDERSREKKPFFLHLAFQIPHVSLRAPEEYKKMYRGKFKEPESLNISKHWSQEKEPKTTYAAMVSYMDHNVGLILRKLKALGMDKDTLVVFSSDNGPEHTGGSDPSYFSSSGKLRGIKRDLYEGGIRVPFVARWPGCIEKGSVSKHVSAFWDFLPTCCELAGIEPPATDGISYLPSLLGKAQKEHDYLYWEFHKQGGKAAIRKGRWKLILTNLKSKIPQVAELFDLEKDIAETNDLSKTRPDIVKELKEKMRSSRVDNERYRLKIE
jgi:arylsulfatase A